MPFTYIDRGDGVSRSQGNKGAVLQWILLLATLMGVSACGSPAEKKFLVVSPPSATLPLNGRQAFTAALSGGGNGGPITWRVNGALGGDDAHGTISSGGVYTAPVDFPESDRILIQASSEGVDGATATVFLTTFDQNRRISNDPAASFRADTRSAGQKNITAFGDKVYTVWSDNRTGDFDVYLARSLNGGTSFELPVRVNSETRGNQIHPAIDVSPATGAIYVVWEDNWKDGSYPGDTDVYFAGSSDDGATFSSRLLINDDAGVTGQTTPTIAAATDGVIFAAWEDNRNSSSTDTDIYLSYSTDGGSTFSKNSKNLRITGQDAVSSKQLSPAMAADDSNNVYLVWEDHVFFYASLYLKKISRDDTGAVVIGTAAPIVTDSQSLPSNTTQVHPALVTDTAGTLYVAWESAVLQNTIPISYNIYLAGSPDGLTFSSPVQVNQTKATGFYGGWAYPALGADDQGISLVWEDFRNGLLNKDIYFTRTSDGGGSFEPARKVNDDEATWHEKPGLTVSGGKTVVFWTDFRNTGPLNCAVCPNDVFIARER